MPATKTSTPKTVLGKRKTRQPPPQQPAEKGEQTPASSASPASPASSSSESVSEEDAQAILRRHFEARFKPLSPSHVSANPKSATTTTEDLRSDDSDDDGDEGDDDASEASWSGVSGADAEDSDLGSDSEEEIEVVSYANSATPSTSNPTLSKREARAYLSSRVPSSLVSSETQTQKQKLKPTAAEEDAPSLLKNDLALQRLLTESHLLSKSKPSTTDPDDNNSTARAGAGAGAGTTSTEHAGRNRHLATDLRLAALGSKRSIFAQQKMPMAMRQGIAGAAGEREARRRREARESGVVLERKAGTGVAAAWLRGFGAAGSGGGSKRGKSKGSGGGGGGGKAVDAPAVGKLRNGMLTLSKRDVSEIQGSGVGGSSRGGGGGGKRRRR